MRIYLVLISFIMLSACASDPYLKRAELERERRVDAVETTLDQAPDWMIDPPKSEAAIYSSGTSSSGDYPMAVHKAKADAYAKICMTAGGRASQRTKIYKADSADTSAEISEMIIRTACKEVDVTGVEVAEKKIVQQGDKFRVYVLVALPLGDANILKTQKDKQKIYEIAAQRAPDAFNELDTDGALNEQ